MFTTRKIPNKVQTPLKCHLLFRSWERGVKVKSINWTLSKADPPKSIKSQISHTISLLAKGKASHNFDLEENLSRYYGCGLVIPEDLEGMDVLDLGSGAGQDCFVLSKLVGESGSVTGVDMTDELVCYINI